MAAELMIPQIIAVLFILGMTFLTFLYFKRKDFDITSFVIWLCVWIITLVLIIVPQAANIFMQKINITRVTDFFLFFGFMFFAAVIFFLYVTVKKNQEKIEILTRNVAIKKAEKKPSKKKK